MMRLTRLAVAVVAVLGTASCSSGSSSAQEVTIKATNAFRFEPARVTAHTGVVKVTLVDVGAYPHNLSVSELPHTSATVTGGLGKDTTQFSLTFNHAGTYNFFCTYHSSAGMRGQFIISGDPK